MRFVLLSAGCNHMKCPKCGAHYCFVCLGDWATHGVEWFNCPYSEREVQFRQMTFYDGVAISDVNMDTIRRMVGKEVDHAILVASIARTLVDERALSSLALALPNTSAAFLTPVLAALLQAHTILQHTHILLCVYKHLLVPHRLTSAMRELLAALAQAEYFADALDRSLVDDSAGTRQVRSAYQLEDTLRVVTLRMRELAQHVNATLVDAKVVSPAEDEVEEGSAAGVKGAAKKESGRGAPMDATMFFNILDGHVKVAR